MSKPNGRRSREYERLARYLRDQPAATSRVTVIFRQIETIIECELPPSARKHRPWWANDASHSYTVWLEAGWETRDVDMRSERVTFVRAARGSRGAAPLEGTASEPRHRPQQNSRVVSFAAAREFSGYGLARVCLIQPECDPDGRPHEYVPQGGYSNLRGLPLHRHGAGPFCRFSIPANLHVAGVYLLLVDDSVRYVGECQNLSERFNSRGYGQIQPRNCYKGGQQTNCRLNRLILEVVKQGHRVELWFHQTFHRRAVESKLIAELAPPWNRTH